MIRSIAKMLGSDKIHSLSTETYNLPKPARRG